MSDAKRDARPLSPHLSVYRPQLNSMTSIFSRITGAALGLTFLLVVLWVIGAAFGGPIFSLMAWFFGTFLGKLVLIASLWAFWYHFAAGVRHLIWDAGYGFDLKLVDLSGWLVIGFSVLLTLLTIAVF